MAKKMKAIDIINSAKQEFASRKVVLKASNGVEYELEIQEKLDDVSVSKLVVDLVERAELCEKNNIEFDVTQNIYFLLIKYFTNVPFNKYKDLEKQYSHELSFIEGLVNLKLFNQLVSYFNEESLQSVKNMFDTYTDTLKPLVNNEVKKQVVKVDE